jgi:hypothetical protein
VSWRAAVAASQDKYRSTPIGAAGTQRPILSCTATYDLHPRRTGMHLHAALPGEAIVARVGHEL